MNIGILGTGSVGCVLAGGFAGIGDKVKLGTRDPGSDKARDTQKKVGTNASVTTFADAAAFGEIVVIATQWAGTENALNLAGHERFNGKVVIDATNPLDTSHGMPPVLTHGHTDSGGEQVQRWLHGAKVVKAFNIVGNAHMINPKFPGGPPDMFICGNDAGAKKVVTDILKKFGWPVIDIGGIEGARLLEPLCILWVVYGMKTNSWNHAFKLLRK